MGDLGYTYISPKIVLPGLFLQSYVKQYPSHMCILQDKSSITTLPHSLHARLRIGTLDYWGKHWTMVMLVGELQTLRESHGTRV